jgi:hypothetical protein
MRANSGALNPLVVTVGRYCRPCCQLGVKTHLRSAGSRSHAGLRSYARCRARSSAGLRALGLARAVEPNGRHQRFLRVAQLCLSLKRPPGRRDGFTRPLHGYPRPLHGYPPARRGQSLLAARSLLAGQEDLATAAEVRSRPSNGWGPGCPLGGRMNQAPRFVRRWNEPVLSLSTRTAAVSRCAEFSRGFPPIQRT